MGKRKQATCNICSKEMRSDTLVRHMKVHQPRVKTIEKSVQTDSTPLEAKRKCEEPRNKKLSVNLETLEKQEENETKKIILTVKICNECDFTSLSQEEMDNHKKNQHEPDDFYVDSAFNDTLVKKIWKVRGIKDPTLTLQAYNAKIRNTIQHYLDTKGHMKWYLGMKVSMIKYEYDGEIATANPEFTTRARSTSMLWVFDMIYKEAGAKIIEDFIEFNQDGSGWILGRVENISVNIIRCVQEGCKNCI